MNPPQTLAGYIESCSRRAFSWGIWDCCLFVADALKYQTGKDPLSRYRALYANEKEANQIVRHLGGFEGVCRVLGVKPVEGPFANGDVGIMERNGVHTALVLFWQGRFLGLDRYRGLSPVAPNHVSKVFRA